MDTVKAPGTPYRTGRGAGPQHTENAMDADTKQLHRKSQTDLTTTFYVFAVVSVIVGAVLQNALYSRSMLVLSPGKFISFQWGNFFDYFEGDWTKMGFTLLGIVILEYWILGGLFLISDLTNWPSFITKYKVQFDQTTIPLDKLYKAMVTVVVNQTVFSIPGLAVLYHLMKWRGCGATVSELPTFPVFAMEIAVSIVLEEIGFYYSHRLLHHPLLYKAIHKKHHEWTAPISLITLYCHPLEHFLSNSAPASLGPLLMGSHMLTTAVWIIVAQTISMIHHSGYHFPLLPSPEFHDFHHLKFTNNFGVFGILDWLHGTDINFRKTKQFQRDRTLLGLTPITQLIPDHPQ